MIGDVSEGSTDVKAALCLKVDLPISVLGLETTMFKEFLPYLLSLTGSQCNLRPISDTIQDPFADDIQLYYLTRLFDSYDLTTERFHLEECNLDDKHELQFQPSPPLGVPMLVISPGGGVLPYKGLMGTCGQPGYVFRDFCLKQGIEFIIFCLNQGIDFSIFVLNRISFLGR